tara:strand:- start:2784 stop:3575 length:792 start_codon:yes stop_codon:yes gene_type:complete
MKNLENLNERVEKAVRKFQQSEEQRRSENQSLSGILNDLETKFEARSAELDHCNSRIKELEASNVSLTALVCQLVEIVEKTANEVSDDPVYRAASAASDIVERFVTDNPLNALGAAAPSADAADTVETAEIVAIAGAAETPAASLSDGVFEDIEDEYRIAEELFEKTEGAATFPKLIYDAMTLARGEEPAAAADMPAEIPVEIPAPPVAEAAPAAPLPGGDLDIKEIMARLELAAERAQLRADADERRDRDDEIGPPQRQRSA